MVSAVGVLALQGDWREHRAALERLRPGEVREVRAPGDLDGLSHLVLPGGESTAIHRLGRLFGLWELLVERFRAGELALFGTCAGAVLLGRAGDGARPPRLELLDAVVERNGYGRQLDSFRAEVEVEGLGTVPGVFIRAPRFRQLGRGVRVLARGAGEPVLVESGGLLASTFHPELTDDLRLHRRFLRLEPAAREAASHR